MTRCLCDLCPPLIGYVIVGLAAPGLLAIVLSLIDRRNSIKCMHRSRRAG